MIPVRNSKKCRQKQYIVAVRIADHRWTLCADALLVVLNFLRIAHFAVHLPHSIHMMTATGIEKDTKEPSDTALHQQRMRAWNPVLDPIAVAVTFIAIAAIFIPVGVKVAMMSNNVVEITNTYDSYNATTSCSIRNPNENKTCQIRFEVPQNMSSPVLIYYEIKNFYQNHRKYIFSRNDKQLLGSTDPLSSQEDIKFCSPLVRLNNSQGNLIDINPCGLIANTLFNDIISLASGKDADGADLNMREDGIAWRSDVRFKFAQPKDFKYELCNCTSCPLDVDNLIWKLYYNTSNNQCYRFYYPNDNTTQYLYETYPMMINPIEGVTNEHFIVWMRVAASPTFRKLYGYFEQSLRKGDILTFNINANWDVSSFNGTKSLVLTTTSPFGGRNPSLGYSFIGVGGFCFVAGMFFILKQMINPRKLADKKYLKYKDE